MSLTTIHRPGLIVPRRPLVKPRFGAKLLREHPLARGLRLAAILNEGGGALVLDLSGNGNHGQVQALGSHAFREPTPYGMGLSFDGDGSTHPRVDFGNVCGGAGTALTVVAFAKFVSGATGPLICKGIGASGNREFQLAVRTGGIAQFGIAQESASSVSYLGTTAAVPAGQYGQYIGVLDGGTQKAGLNGRIDATKSVSISIEDKADSLLFAYNENSEETVTIIVYAYIWFRALSEAELAWVYREPFAMFAAPGAGTLFLASYSAGGAGSQTATCGFISSESTAYAPTATPGAVTATAGFIASGSAVYDPSASPGAVTATAGFISSGSTVYDPTATVAGSTQPLPVADNFNRSNRNLDGDTASDGSHTWATFANDGLQIESNVAGDVTGGFDGSYIDNMPNTADIEASATVVTKATRMAVLARCDASGNGYGVDWETTAGIRIVKFVTGSLDSVLATIGGTLSATDSLGIRCVGTTIYALKNGSSQGSTTDASFSTGKVGLYIGNGSGQWDDFAALAPSLTATCGFISSSSQAFDPSTTTTVAAAAGFIASGSQAFDAAATVGNITATCTFISSGSQVFAPTATPGAILATAGFISSGSVAYDADAAPGAVTADAGFIPSGSTAFDTSATLGGPRAFCDFIASESVAYNATASVEVIAVHYRIDLSACVTDPMLLACVTDSELRACVTDLELRAQTVED